MSTQQTAPTNYILASGTKLAYRRFGSSTSTIPPLVLLIHFRGSMDHWDPLLINLLASQREIILLDNAGVGKSEGEIPESFSGWAEHVINLVRALGLEKIDLLGFSMGGMVAQLVALNAKGLVRRLLITGSGPSKGEGVLVGDGDIFNMVASAGTYEENEKAFLETFFSLTEEKQALGRKWWTRVNERQVATSGETRSSYVGPEGTQRQINSVIKYATGVDDTFSRLGELDIPVFVANGDHDVLVPTVNSWIMSQRIKDAHLHVFPDSGHGAIFEYAEVFAGYVDGFLGH